MAEESTSPTVPPHSVIADHYGSARERVGYIRRLFDDSAASYDRINAWMSINTGERYRREVLRRHGLTQGQDVLDLACGTGVIASHAHDLVGDTGSVIAIDPSMAMLAEAGHRVVKARVAAIAERLPLRNGCIDLVVMGYALRHLADLRPGFEEMFRVLKPGGRLLVLEMVPPRSKTGYAISKFYLKTLVPAVTFLVTRNAHARRLMEYYWETVDQCIPPEAVMRTMREAGFAHVRRHTTLGLFTEYSAARDISPDPS